MFDYEKFQKGMEMLSEGIVCSGPIKCLYMHTHAHTHTYLGNRIIRYVCHILIMVPEWKWREAMSLATNRRLTS